MTGAGIYIEESEYIGYGVPNNSFVVSKSTTCTNCRLDIYCCSEASTGTAYVEFPDSVTKESSDDYNNIVVEQLSDTAGVRVYNYKSYMPQLAGLYTCHVPSLQGETLASSVVVYGNDLPGKIIHISMPKLLSEKCMLNIYVLSLYRCSQSVQQ